MGRAEQNTIDEHTDPGLIREVQETATSGERRAGMKPTHVQLASSSSAPMRSVDTNMAVETQLTTDSTGKSNNPNPPYCALNMQWLP